MTTDLETRLIRCFSSIFPGASTDEIKKAQMETLKGWDSISMVNLISVLEEEFQVSFDLDDIERFTSFDKVRAYLQQNGN